MQQKLSSNMTNKLGMPIYAYWISDALLSVIGRVHRAFYSTWFMVLIIVCIIFA